MIRLILVLVVLISGVALALLSFGDQDYVVIGAGQWVIQTSLTVFVGLLVIAFIPAYMIVRTLFAIWRSPRVFKAWRRDRRERNAQDHLAKGLTSLAEGRWRRAERELTRGVEGGANPLLGHIAAARAAQALGAHDRRDDYLRRASDAKPSSSVAVGLTQAELHLDDHQREQALATLLQLRAQAPNHDRILMLLRHLFEDLRDWESLLDLVPALKSHKVIDADEASALETRAHSGLLVKAAVSGGADALDFAWNALPKALQARASLLGLYTELMMVRGGAHRCEPLLRAVIKKHWDDDLVRLYARIEGADSAAQLKQAESWLASRQDNAILLEALGRLCVSNRLWGKARSYLDASLAVEPHADTYAALVDLMDRLEDAEAAGDYARKGLSLAPKRSGYLDDPEWRRVLDNTNGGATTGSPVKASAENEPAVASVPVPAASNA